MLSLVFLIAFVAIGVAVVLGVSLYRANKSLKFKDLRLKSLALQISDLEKENNSKKKEVELFRELVFFLQLGYTPTKKEKQKMMSQVVDSMKLIDAMQSKYSSFKNERALMVAEHLNATGKELCEILDSLRDSLSESLSGNKSIYPKLTDYIYYCGFKFCHREESCKVEIKDYD